MDLDVLRKFVKSRGQDRLEEAAKQLAEQVEWQSLDGQVRRGRESCIAYFQEQVESGIKTSQASDWSILPEWSRENRDGESYEADQQRTTYIAQRAVQVKSPKGASCSAKQIATVRRGLIARMVVRRDAQRWEPGLEPREVLSRFAVLRKHGDDAGAAECLAPDVEWHKLGPPPDSGGGGCPEDTRIAGRAPVEALWREHREKKIDREIVTDWVLGPKDEYTRRLRLTGGPYENGHLVVQTAKVTDGRIIYVAHAFSGTE